MQHTLRAEQQACVLLVLACERVMPPLRLLSISGLIGSPSAFSWSPCTKCILTCRTRPLTEADSSVYDEPSFPTLQSNVT